MDKITRYEWHGSGIVLLLLFFLGITIPLAVVYLMTHLLRIETQVADGAKLSDFLQTRE
jgi:cytochrome c biogenesis protein CcdA